jgi:hypothetical protein
LLLQKQHWKLHNLFKHESSPFRNVRAFRGRSRHVMITAILPTYNNADIIWLQLESLCAQVNTPEWELIIIEEPSEQYFGEDGLSLYAERLGDAGCVRVVYISVTNWIPLAQKWVIGFQNMSPESVGAMLCASDNYSPCTRVAESYEALVNGADWYQTRSGYFYNILNNEAAIFNKKDTYKPALFMAISKDGISRVKKFDYPKKGVDSWLFNQVLPQKMIEKEFEPNGTHTDGFNTISHNRRHLYNGSDFFEPTDPNNVLNIFPKYVKDRIYKQRSFTNKLHQNEPIES